MGKQHNKDEHKRRRKAYIKRKKAAVKSKKGRQNQGVTRLRISSQPKKAVLPGGLFYF